MSMDLWNSKEKGLKNLKLDAYFENLTKTGLSSKIFIIKWEDQSFLFRRLDLI